MPGEFDPYYLWLSIPPDSGLRHHYRLLGISAFESDENVIDAAANRLTAYVKSVAAGDRKDIGDRIVSELAEARQILLSPQERGQYDDWLRTQLSSDDTTRVVSDESPDEKLSPTEAQPSINTARNPQKDESKVVTAPDPADSESHAPTAVTSSTLVASLAAALSRLLKTWWKELVIYGSAATLTLAIVSVLLLSGDRQPVEPTNDTISSAIVDDERTSEATVSVSTESSQPDEVDKELIGRWNFNEAAGSHVEDESGRGHNGTIHGATWTERDAQSALDFDGDDWIDLENPAGMNFSGMITIAAWIRPEATDGYRNILAHGFDPEANREVVMRINDARYQVGSWTGEDAIASGGDASADLNTWVHLTGVYDGTHWRLYRNGQEVNSVEHSQSAVEVNRNWAIGAMDDGNGRHFNGGIDDVLLYSRALSADEVSHLYESYTLPEESQ